MSLATASIREAFVHGSAHKGIRSSPAASARSPMDSKRGVGLSSRLGSVTADGNLDNGVMAWLRGLRSIDCRCVKPLRR